jgi:hypothetical protein
MDLLFYISAFYLAPDLVLGDFNLPKIGWSPQGDGFMPENGTTDLENDLIEGLFSCDLGQIDANPNQYGSVT